jgi:hypothetical protein
MWMQGMRRKRRQKDGKKRERLQIKKNSRQYKEEWQHNKYKKYTFFRSSNFYTHDVTTTVCPSLWWWNKTVAWCGASLYKQQVDEKKEQKAVDSQHKTSLSATNTEIKLHKTLLLQCLLHSALICLREVITSRYQNRNDYIDSTLQSHNFCLLSEYFTSIWNLWTTQRLSNNIPALGVILTKIPKVRFSGWKSNPELHKQR